jgi:hypothetical protein
LWIPTLCLSKAGTDGRNCDIEIGDGEKSKSQLSKLANFEIAAVLAVKLQKVSLYFYTKDRKAVPHFKKNCSNLVPYF